MRPILFTAGATRNPVDAIRYLSAGASGGTAVALAASMPDRRIHLLGSPEALLRAQLAGVRGTLEAYGGTRDLMARMERAIRATPDAVVVHSAAVGDYELAAPTTEKIPSGRESITLTLVPAPKIVDRVREWAPDAALVSFKAAPPGTTPDALEAIARAQLVRTRSDLVFANALGALDTSVLLVSATGAQAFERRDAAVEALRAWINAR